MSNVNGGGTGEEREQYKGVANRKISLVSV